MRQLIHECWSGDYGFKDREEAIDRALALHQIIYEEWVEFLGRRRPIEMSLERVGDAGIFLKDLSDYHRVPQQDLVELLSVIGAVQGEDGRFRLPGRLAGSETRPFAGIVPGKGAFYVLDPRSVRPLLKEAGAAGLSLEEVAVHVGRPAEEVHQRLTEAGFVRGEDGRFRSL